MRSETLETAITCNSIWEEEETGTGATGAEGVFGAEQQGILQQWWPGQQHELVAGAVPAKAITGDAARRNTSDNATANLVSLNPMPFFQPLPRPAKLINHRTLWTVKQILPPDVTRRHLIKCRPRCKGMHYQFKTPWRRNILGLCFLQLSQFSESRNLGPDGWKRCPNMPRQRQFTSD